MAMATESRICHNPSPSWFSRECGIPSTSWISSVNSNSTLGCVFAYNSAQQLLDRGRMTRIVTSAQHADDIHSVVRALQSKNHRARKALGQHYMVNERINRELVAAANIAPGDLVLEIGPGTGALTSMLLDAGAKIVTVEKDWNMASIISSRFGGRVEVITEDIMRWPVRQYMTQYASKYECSKPAKVVSNLPFNITTDIVKELLPMGDLFSSMTLLVQDEVAIRFTEATVNSDVYRPVNLFINFYSDVEYKLKVDRSNFLPRPNVDAAVVVFNIKQACNYPKVVSKKEFFTLVNSAFSGKRKMLRSSLQHLYSSNVVQSALTAAGLPETARPQELSLQQFVDLHNTLASSESSRVVAIQC